MIFLNNRILMLSMCMLQRISIINWSIRFLKEYLMGWGYLALMAPKKRRFSKQSVEIFISKLSSLWNWAVKRSESWRRAFKMLTIWIRWERGIKVFSTSARCLFKRSRIDGRIGKQILIRRKRERQLINHVKAKMLIEVSLCLHANSNMIRS